LDGIRQMDVAKFMEQLAHTPPGTTVSLEIWRDGRLITRQATLSQRPRR
jgi:S1-C subfamily serine protease